MWRTDLIRERTEFLALERYFSRSLHGVPLQKCGLSSNLTLRADSLSMTSQRLEYDGICECWPMAQLDKNSEHYKQEAYMSCINLNDVPFSQVILDFRPLRPEYNC